MKSLTSDFRVAHPVLLLFAMMFVYCTGNSANAQYFTGAVATATGGAGRAAPEPSETVLLNPATLAHAPDLSAGFYYFHGGNTRQDSTNTYGGTLLDNQPDSLFPGAVSYLRQHRTFPSGPNLDEHFMAIHVGDFVWDQVSLGASLIRLEQKEEDPNGETYIQWNGVLGFHHNPTPNFAWGVVWYHMANPSGEVPVAYRLMPRVGLGMNYIFENITRVRLDISQDHTLNPERKFRFESGVETFLGQFVVLRLGVSRDENRNQTWLSGGVSFHGPQFKLDYTMAQTDGAGDGTLHSVDLRLPF